MFFLVLSRTVPLQLLIAVRWLSLKNPILFFPSKSDNLFRRWRPMISLISGSSKLSMSHQIETCLLLSMADICKIITIYTQAEQHQGFIFDCGECFCVFNRSLNPWLKFCCVKFYKSMLELFRRFVNHFIAISVLLHWLTSLLSAIVLKNELK